MAKSKNDYRAYVEGFALVNALEIEELQRITPEQSLREFAALLELATAMNWETHTPEEIEEVRRRWIKLKKRSPEPS